jgi:radical SAM superfamily enzyme YgiQ (UPF0313 family)
LADIVLINPRFRPSFWGLEHALPAWGKRANMPVSSLPLLAALTPAAHRVTLIDENVEEIDWQRCARADVVGVTGLSVQRFRMREILGRLKSRGAFTAVGGAWVSVQEDYFGALADVIFVGEAEETWPRFLDDWAAGRPQSRYEQPEKTDMTRVPTPRLDLLPMRHYVFGSVQFSRGCPFQCEFCDIIVTFGRRPRLKSVPQILAELEALRAQGMALVFIVDDNLIGNKKAIKGVLRSVKAWQQAHGFPLAFFTEASIDLADDPELMALLTDCNVFAVFVGIESPNEKSLRETKKFQNLRGGGTMLDKVHRIQRAGIDVWCGMILGFDNDDPSIFQAHRDFIRRAHITSAMFGMLYAVPKTPLHARLAAAGRLDPADEPDEGTNVIPLRLTREQLGSGYVAILKDLYEPESYFDRLDELFLAQRLRLGNRQCKDYWKRHPWRFLTTQLGDWSRFLYLYHRLMQSVRDTGLRDLYRRRILRLLRVRRDGGVLVYYVVKCAMHYHAYRLAQENRTGGRLINVF